MVSENQSVIGKLPDPDTIHRELLDTLRLATTLRKLLRISQKQPRQLDHSPAQSDHESEAVQHAK